MKTKHRFFAFTLTTLALSISNAYAENAAIAEGDKPVTEQIVNTLTKLSGGPHQGYRANHAKGIVVQGEFVPAKSAAGLSKAVHLQTNPSPATVRFSNATGVPTIPDADGNAFPKGIAIRFQLADGAYTDIVSISTNGFPAAKPEDFLGLLNAIAASGPDAIKPTPVEQFLGSHPAALAFVKMPKPAPVSFATQAFYGVNAFKFTNAKGQVQYGRYRITPVNGAQFLSKAEKGDDVNDPTMVWPETRKQVELGTLTLNNVDANGVMFEKTTMFNPLTLVDGIEASEDPILLARPGAYAVSYGRRLGQ
jgi:catalase